MVADLTNYWPELFNIIVCALLFRLRGGGVINQDIASGGREVPRWVYVVGMAGVIAINTPFPAVWPVSVADAMPSALYFAGWMLVSMVLGCMPTRPLLDLTQFGATVGQAIKAGFLRALPAVPAAIVNPWISLFLAHGLVYYLAGKQKKSPPVTIAEIILGGWIGGML